MKIFETRVKPFTTNSNKDYKTPIKEIISHSSLSYLLSPIRSKRFLIKLLWLIFLILFLFGSILTEIFFSYFQRKAMHLWTAISTRGFIPPAIFTHNFCSPGYEIIFNNHIQWNKFRSWRVIVSVPSLCIFLTYTKMIVMKS